MGCFQGFSWSNIPWVENFKTFTFEKYGGWESSTHCKYKKRLQIKKTTSSIWQHARCKCSQHNQKKKRAANRKQRLQIKKTTFIHLTTHTLLMLTTQPKKKRAANKMYLVVLWAFAVCFFICLCCEHLHHLLSNWWRCFLDLLVLFLFACLFWSCSALSSLGHRRKGCFESTWIEKHK